ncbi:MAG TPA: PilZ domain-containing protein [Polyangiaceae bacterium]|jgi:uncharacterized protein (TIGR02266 family)
MQQERRSAHRARVPGAHVTYESASDAAQDGEALDISAGGMFIRTAKPAPVGRRLAIELRLAGDGRSFSALGRVMWTRPSAGPFKPSGMGVQLIDIDEAALHAIERAVASMPPARERTVRGVGTPAPPVVAAARRPPRRGRAEPIALLFAAAATIALCVMHDRIPWALLRGVSAATPGTAPAPTMATPSSTVTAFSIPSTTAAATTSATAFASAIPSAAPAASKASPRPAPPRWWTTAPRRPTGVPNDNPY